MVRIRLVSIGYTFYYVGKNMRIFFFLHYSPVKILSCQVDDKMLNTGFTHEQCCDHSALQFKFANNNFTCCTCSLYI